MAPIEEEGGAKGEEAADAPEDLPIVKELKEVDDRYLALEREYEKERQELQKKYTEMQRPFLEQRRDILTTCDGTPSTGTPALKGFWLQAMKNHPAFEECIQEWDEPVLEYLVDIEKSDLNEDDSDKGFKITFKFMENPYFSNSELTKEWHTEETNPYCGEIDCTKITATEIEWKAGKNVTVEKVQKRAKGGGAKKAKQKKEKEEARASFFRDLFRNLEPGMELTEDLKEQARSLQDDDDDEDDDMDMEDMIDALMDQDHEVGTALRDNIIPFAVRWYTGEAAPEVPDGDEEDEEEDGEDGTDDDESSEDAPKAPARPTRRGRPSPEVKPSEQPKEECKQQ